MKRKIRLTESDLRHIIKESVKRVLREEEANNQLDWVKNELFDALSKNTDRYGVWFDDSCGNRYFEGFAELYPESEHGVLFGITFPISLEVFSWGYDEPANYDVESWGCGPGGWVDGEYELTIEYEDGVDCSAISYKMKNEEDWKDLPLDDEIINVFKSKEKELAPTEDEVWDHIEYEGDYDDDPD